MIELLDGVQRELGSAISNKTKAALDAFRERICETSAAPRRKRFERELEAFLQSKPALRAASERYVCEKIPPAIEAAVGALMRALPLLKKRDRTVRQIGAVSRTRKRRRKHKSG
jgi:hypothetical protein